MTSVSYVYDPYHIISHHYGSFLIVYGTIGAFGEREKKSPLGGTRKKILLQNVQIGTF